ncbi:MAG: ABC transporter ATP-binding protein [Nitrososphaerota archaeon]|nr:ABC transporter ATP-binding protein [Nitrososphaerota archaeon]MDG6938942.1 ABC transporter ATP-binding protein [Nitrososphaerota archaeon]
MLEVRDVSKKFSGLVAVDGVSLEAYEGEAVGLIGPNGAGKTTLFNMISGSIHPTSGRIYYNGRDITSLSPDRICRLGIARTFQIPQPFGDMTVLKNVETALLFGGRASKGGILPANAADICEMAGLADKKGMPARTLGVSDKKKLEMARAIATAPKVILLDEIASGLPVGEYGWATGLVRRLVGEFGLTVIWIEHVMRVIMRTVDRVYVLDHGSRIAHGKPEEVVNDEQVRQAYLGAKVG